MCVNKHLYIFIDFFNEVCYNTSRKKGVVLKCNNTSIRCLNVNRIIRKSIRARLLPIR